MQGTGGVEEAQGNVASAAAQVPVSSAGVTAGQAQVAAAQAAVPGAAQSLAQARADLNRTQSLVNTGDVARQELDAAQAAYARAASQYQTALDNVSVAQANVAQAQQKVAASQAGIASAQGGVTTAQGKLAQAREPAQIAAQRAAVAIAQQSLSNTRIAAPIDGYVGQKNVEVGQTVSPGMSLLTLVPQHSFITAYFKETQVGNMRAGQPVDVHVDAYKGVTFHGRVLSLNPASQNTYAVVPAQNSTGNFVKVTQRIPVKISIDDADPQRYPMRPGMSVEASVQVN
ncbi:MAG: HlyD family secretion protein [Candidatus Eremiobacteraeota bacterium]|nr:HlyD family secretion protein [Candidatus Eremiobacteraeota bacterium]